MSGIKEIIKNYIQIDDEIKSINKQTKPLKIQKEMLGAQIQEYLSSNSETPNSVLEVGKDIFKIVSVSRKKFVKDNFEEAVKTNTSEDVAKIIFGSTIEESETTTLRRVTKK